MTGEMFTQIVMIIITILGAIITYLVVPYIKSKTTQKQQEQIQTWISIAVNAAEQILNTPEMGENKKEFVINFLRNQGINLAEEQLNMLIEAAVYQMNLSQNTNI